MKSALSFFSLETPIGSMLAIANETSLYFLNFSDQDNLDKKIETLKIKTQLDLVSGKNYLTGLLEAELKAYFEGKLKIFNIPLCLVGTPFQKLSWEALKSIPYGETKSYSDQASYLNKPLACRAVGNANKANLISILIPCHRVLNNNGMLGGYAGGIKRKEWLLNHERNFKMTMSRGEF